MKWITYDYVCGLDSNGAPIHVTKRIEYSEGNITIAQSEAYNGYYYIEEDGKSVIREPLKIEFGGTNARTAKEACKNIGAIPVPENKTISEGLVYQNEDGSTRLIKQKQFKYSIIIDESDLVSNSIEYADDCMGFVPMKRVSNGVIDEGDWTSGNALLQMFKPCVISPDSDTPAYYLDKTNLSKKVNGEDAVLTGKDGDVMIEVDGLLYGKFQIIPFSESTTFKKIKISIMNYEEPGCFCFNDFGGEIKPKFYRGRYTASVTSNNIMRSVSGVEPLRYGYFSNYREYARNRGTGYHQNNVYMLFLWQAMFLLLFKDRNSQKSLGYGRAGFAYDPYANNYANCGWSDNLGWIYGTSNTTTGMVFLGVEDFYGNTHECVDGVIIDNNLTYRLTRNPELYNDFGNGYEISAESNLPYSINSESAYLRFVAGTNNACFLPTGENFNASSSYGYCDKFTWQATGVTNMIMHGGNISSYSEAGAFCFYMYGAVTNSLTGYCGSRLCRK